MKRQIDPFLHKKNQKPRKLKSRDFNYDLVEDINRRKHPDLQVILTQFVEGLGQKGDIINVRPTFAYNKLLLPGLAVYVTPENIEKFKPKAGEVTHQEEKHSSQFAQRTVNMLQYRVFAIVMNKDHPWELEPWHIRASLRKCGYFIKSDSAIELPAEKITGPDLTKQNKEFIVIVTVNNTEKAKVRCRIHHWSVDPSDRLPYVFEHWKQDAEPLFNISAKN